MSSGDFKEKRQIAEIRRDVDFSGVKKMLNDNVLVEIDQDLSKVFEKNGIWLSLDFDKHNADNTIRHGIVRELPDKFIYREEYGYGADWLNRLQIRHDDRVWFSVVGSAESEKVIIGDKLYYIIPYKELIVAKRSVLVKDEDYKLEYVIHEYGSLCEVIMLNGFILLQPKLEEQHAVIKTKPKKSKDCVVCFCGEPNLEYFKGHFFDDDRISVGDNVRIHLLRGYLEDPLHKCFDGDNEYMVAQRRHLNYKY